MRGAPNLRGTCLLPQKGGGKAEKKVPSRKARDILLREVSEGKLEYQRGSDQ